MFSGFTEQKNAPAPVDTECANVVIEYSRVSQAKRSELKEEPPARETTAQLNGSRDSAKQPEAAEPLTSGATKSLPVNGESVEVRPVSRVGVQT